MSSADYFQHKEATDKAGCSSADFVVYINTWLEPIVTTTLSKSACNLAEKSFYVRQCKHLAILILCLWYPVAKTINLISIKVPGTGI